MDVVPEITPDQLSERLRGSADVYILDVREGWELTRARLPAGSFQHLPLSALLRGGQRVLPAPPTGKETIVLCHHGIRSAQVARWLIDLGWERVSHLHGGLDAYARTVDPEIGSY